MNNTEIKQIALAYNTLFKSTKAFSAIRDTLITKIVDDKFQKEEIETIKTEYQQRLIVLEQFEKELDKFEKILPSEVYKQLKSALSEEKTILGRIIADASGYLELNDEMYLTSLMDSFKKEQDIDLSFSKEMNTFANDIGFNLLKQAIDNKITLEDLKLMAEAFEKDSPLYERVKFSIDFLERREKEVTKGQESEKKEEPEESKEETGKTEETPSLSLQEKLNNINYQTGTNLNVAVQELTVEDAITGLQKQIDVLQAKDKLTVKETFTLRQLQEQQLAFQAYMESLDDQKLTSKEKRTNKKLDKTLDRIELKTSELQAAIEQSNQYQSRVLRFFSARYQSRLKEEIEALQRKQGMMTTMQKQSAIARYNKQSKKLVRRAKRKGTIEQLKEYRNSLVNELSNISQDISRFVSTKDQDMEELEQSVIVLPDNIISLSEYQANLERGKVA